MLSLGICCDRVSPIGHGLSFTVMRRRLERPPARRWAEFAMHLMDSNGHSLLVQGTEIRMVHIQCGPFKACEQVARQNLFLLAEGIGRVLWGYVEFQKCWCPLRFLDWSIYHPRHLRMHYGWREGHQRGVECERCLRH